MCDVQKTQQSELIRVSLSSIKTDFHAADSRYHVECRTSYMHPRYIKKDSEPTQNYEEHEPYIAIVHYLELKQTLIHNSIDLHGSRNRQTVLACTNAPKTEYGYRRASTLETVTYLYPPEHRDNTASKQASNIRVCLLACLQGLPCASEGICT